MKKVSVTDKYTYDGTEMTEREVKMYKCGIEDGQVTWRDILFIAITSGLVGIAIGGVLCQITNH